MTKDDTTMELMPVKERPRVITRFSMPKGNYDSWTTDEAFQAELLSKLFANTYIRDFNATNAAIRLGCPTVEAAHVIGSDIFNHWLTQHHIDALIGRFDETKVLTPNSVGALLWRDASNFEPTANPMARVAAQKCLAVAMGMTAVQVRKKQEEDLNSVRGGVVWVEAQTIQIPDWEGVALEAQAEMMAALEDDGIVHGAEML